MLLFLDFALTFLAGSLAACKDDSLKLRVKVTATASLTHGFAVHHATIIGQL